MHDTTTQRFPWVGLFTLSALVFASVTSEFLPTGLLPDMARELDVTESQVGLLITLFAGTVVVTAAPLAVLTRRFARKSLLLVVLGLFIVANVLSAFAPTYEVLAGSRVIGGLTHGLFWSIVGAYAAHLVPKKRLGRAVAIVSGGGTAAFVLGVPLGTALGHALGWRLAFAFIAGMMAVLLIVAIRFVPSVQHIEPLKTGESALPIRRDRTIPGVVFVCLMVFALMFAHNIFYTYIAPFLIGPVGVDPGGVAGILLLYGLAGAVGLALAGVFSDRFPRASLPVAGILIAVSVLVLGLAPGQFWAAMVAFVVWSIAFGGIPAMLQTQMMHVASVRVRDVASAYQTTAFNAAIGSGALVGGILLDRVGLFVLPFADVAITVLGVLLAIVGGAWWRRREASWRVASSSTPIQPKP